MSTASLYFTFCQGALHGQRERISLLGSASASPYRAAAAKEPFMGSASTHLFTGQRERISLLGSGRQRNEPFMGVASPGWGSREPSLCAPAAEGVALLGSAEGGLTGRPLAVRGQREHISLLGSGRQGALRWAARAHLFLQLFLLGGWGSREPSLCASAAEGVALLGSPSC